MAPPTIPTCPPAALVAGDSATWDDADVVHRLYGAFDSGTWTLTYELVGPTGAGAPAVTLTGSVQGSGWRTTLSSTQSQGLKDIQNAGPDVIRWVRRVSSGSDKFTVADGTFLLLASPADLQEGTQSKNQQVLTQLEQARDDILTTGMSSFQVQGRAATLLDLPTIEKMIASYSAKVWREQHPGELGPAVAMRFTERHL